MEIKKAEQHDIVVLELHGRLDTATATALEHEFTQLVAGSRTKIVVDFAEVVFMSSSGLRTLLLAGRQIKNIGGKIVLCALQEQVKNVFEVAGFSMLFEAFATKAQAIEALR